MYGSALGSPDNGYQISEGWFAGVKSIYDPDETFVDDLISPGHSIYGYIDAKFNIQVRCSLTSSYTARCAPLGCSCDRPQFRHRGLNATKHALSG